MPKKRHSPEEVVSKLRQVDVIMAQSQPIATAVKTIGVTKQSYYWWRNVRQILEVSQCTQ
jgi:putative transposase